MKKRGNHKIKVCYLIGSLKIGGAQRHLVKLLNALDRSRVEPVLVLFKEEGDLISEIRRLQIPIYELSINKLYGLHSISCLYKFVKYLREQDIDVLHTFIWQANFFGAVAGIIARKKVVISKRSTNDWMTAPYLMISRLTNMLADKVSVVSEDVAKTVRERERASEAKLFVVPNGVDLPGKIDVEKKEALQKELVISDRAIKVGVIASLVPVKGHIYFIDAIRKVVNEYPEIQVLLVGDGILRSELEARVHQLGIDDNVQFLGYRNDVEGILGLLDIFVLPSLEEGMSNAVLEAMAHGLPIIVTDAAGSFEIVENGKSGIIVQKGNSEPLAKALLNIIRDKAYRLSLGMEARKRVEREYSMSQVVSRNLQVYEELLAERY